MMVMVMMVVVLYFLPPDILLKSNMKAAMRAVLMVRMVMVYVRTDR